MRFKTSLKKISLILLILLLGLSLSAATQQGGTAKSDSIKIADRVYFLDGLPCNVVAVAGADGILLIDNGAAQSAGNLIKKIAEFDAGPVRIVINTHYHFDHIGANEHLARDGAVIVAQENARHRMQTEWRVPDWWGFNYPVIPPYPEAALPKVSFKDTLTLHYNGMTIEAIHFPKAHSEADIAIYLRDVNVLHTGDLYLSNGFPIIESSYGGTIDGVISAVDKLVGLINDNTKVVPGHGPVSNRQGLCDYRKMLAVGRDRIAVLIKEGKTLEEIMAADPTAGLYKKGKDEDIIRIISSRKPTKNEQKVYFERLI